MGRPYPWHSGLMTGLESRDLGLGSGWAVITPDIPGSWRSIVTRWPVYVTSCRSNTQPLTPIVPEPASRSTTKLTWKHHLICFHAMQSNNPLLIKNLNKFWRLAWGKARVPHEGAAAPSRPDAGYGHCSSNCVKIFLVLAGWKHVTFHSRRM